MDQSIGDLRTIKEGGASVRLPENAADHSMGSLETLGQGGGARGRIDQYELVRELGGGGFGVVYLARDTVAGVDVAVKGMPPLVRNNVEELERIRENFALVSKLHHPNIAAALVLHPAREVSYASESVQQALRVMSGNTLMVMTYAPGVTLNKWRKQFPDGKAPVDQALDVCRQIAAALDYAHGEKVVHRDVKPSNVMVETREDGLCKREEGTLNAQVVVRVLDFGLAAEIRSSLSRVSQEKGDMSGTRPYMAPEQWAGKRQDGRTDQYALAALFYELVSGAVPFASAFDTGDPVIMANAAENKLPQPLAELTKAQNAALLRGLAKDPAGRFASCGDFVAALGGAHAESSGLRGKRGAFWLAGAAALIAAASLSVQSVRARNARLASERAAAQQAAASEAAQQAKLAGLKSAAEAALASGDLETAGARIAELDRAGASVGSSELHKRYESKAGERETNKRYAAASVAREAVQRLARGQGFGARLDALEVTWREAEAARQGQGWSQALSGYDAVLAACKTLTEMGGARGDAEVQRDKAQKEMEAALCAKTAESAKELFESGGLASSRAADAFERGDFAGASKAWQDAAASYAAAKTRAVAIQGYKQAKADFEAKLRSVKLDELEKWGGRNWLEAKNQQRKGEAATDVSGEGKQAYVGALSALLKAVGDVELARQAELGRLAAAAKAEEEKRTQEKEQAQHKAKKEELQREVAVGTDAMGKGNYSAAYAAYKNALTLSPNDSTLKTNLLHADAMLSRLNPLRAAKKGDWWRTRHVLTSSRFDTETTIETKVTEVTDELLTCRVTTRRKTGGQRPTESESVVDRICQRNSHMGLFETKEVYNSTTGSNKGIAAAGAMKVDKDGDVAFLGIEKITVGPHVYACKRIVKKSKIVTSLFTSLIEVQSWVSEDAPVPVLKSVTTSKRFDADNQFKSQSTLTKQCTNIEPERLTVGGVAMNCLKVTEQTDSGQSVTWYSVDYPWLGHVMYSYDRNFEGLSAKTVEKLEAFGSEKGEGAVSAGPKALGDANRGVYSGG